MCTLRKFPTPKHFLSPFNANRPYVKEVPLPRRKHHIQSLRTNFKTLSLLGDFSKGTLTWLIFIFGFDIWSNYGPVAIKLFHWHVCVHTVFGSSRFHLACRLAIRSVSLTCKIEANNSLTLIKCAVQHSWNHTLWCWNKLHRPGCLGQQKIAWGNRFFSVVCPISNMDIHYSSSSDHWKFVQELP